MTGPLRRARMALALTAATATGATTALAAPQLRQCAFSYSPAGAHVAVFHWRGGDHVTFEICRDGCHPVRVYAVLPGLAYRWEGAGRLTVFEPRALRRGLIGRFGGVEVHAAPASAARGADVIRVRVGRRTCFIPESVTVEEDAH